MPKKRRAPPEAPRRLLRFRGFPVETQRFLETLEPEPCPSEWPGKSRVTYAAHILTPLKDLVTDLKELLKDVSPALGLEPRVGASLFWTDASKSDPECPVRLLQAWDRRTSMKQSAVLYAKLLSAGIEVGAAAANADPEASLRVQRALEAGSGIREAALALLTSGWEVSGERSVQAGGGRPETGLDLWRHERGLRVSRQLPWKEWIDEPGFAYELAARFREVLPVFDAMRGVDVDSFTLSVTKDE